MKKYTVSFVLKYYVDVDVEAEDEDEAENLATDIAESGGIDPETGNCTWEIDDVQEVL